MTLGEFLRAFRWTLHLTQEQFAEQLEKIGGYERNVYARSIQRWEHDQVRPKQSTLHHIRMINAKGFDDILETYRRHMIFQQQAYQISCRFRTYHLLAPK